MILAGKIYHTPTADGSLELDFSKDLKDSNGQITKGEARRKRYEDLRKAQRPQAREVFIGDERFAGQRLEGWGWKL